MSLIGARAAACPSRPGSREASAGASGASATADCPSRCPESSTSPLGGSFPQSALRLTTLVESGYGALAQLGERRLCKPEVAGSNPACSIQLLPALPRDCFAEGLLCRRS